MLIRWRLNFYLSGNPFELCDALWHCFLLDFPHHNWQMTVAYPLLVPVIHHAFPQIAKTNFPPRCGHSEFTSAITHALLRNNDGQRPSLPPSVLLNTCVHSSTSRRVVPGTRWTSRGGTARWQRPSLCCCLRCYCSAFRPARRNNPLIAQWGSST